MKTTINGTEYYFKWSHLTGGEAWDYVRLSKHDNKQGKKVLYTNPYAYSLVTICEIQVATVNEDEGSRREHKTLYTGESILRHTDTILKADQVLLTVTDENSLKGTITMVGKTMPDVVISLPKQKANGRKKSLEDALSVAGENVFPRPVRKQIWEAYSKFYQVKLTTEQKLRRKVADLQTEVARLNEFIRSTAITLD